MSLSPDDILLHAEIMCSAEDEASIRFSVSRAYYANYHEAFIKAQDLGIAITPDKGVHHSLISSLGRRGGSFGVVSRKLKKLKMDRVKSDYKLDEVISRSDAELIVIKAKRLIQEIRELSA